MYGEECADGTADLWLVAPFVIGYLCAQVYTRALRPVIPPTPLAKSININDPDEDDDSGSDQDGGNFGGPKHGTLQQGEQVAPSAVITAGGS